MPRHTMLVQSLIIYDQTAFPDTDRTEMLNLVDRNARSSGQKCQIQLLEMLDLVYLCFTLNVSSMNQGIDRIMHSSIRFGYLPVFQTHHTFLYYSVKPAASSYPLFPLPLSASFQQAKLLNQSPQRGVQRGRQPASPLPSPQLHRQQIKPSKICYNNFVILPEALEHFKMGKSLICERYHSMLRIMAAP